MNVLTYHYDNTRQGANLAETALTPANVDASNFGQLFTYSVDGYVYAQPLYVSALKIPVKGTHNVVFVATENNSVYAFDADTNAGANSGLLWQVNLGPAAAAPNPNSFPFQIIQPVVGITGTPVIDLLSKTLYVDTFTQNGTSYSHIIHALSILDGAEESFSPVTVSASVPGEGAGSVNGVLSFQAVQELQRSALTLANGVLYVAFAGYTDTPQTDPYHGWIIGFNASNLKPVPNCVFLSTPNGTSAEFGSINGRGGIWMAGGGIAVDDNNNLFFGTGDGNFTAFPGTSGNDYGDSVIKLSTSKGLSVADYFTPYNQDYFRTNDLDVGSGGVILLPDQPGPFPHLMIAGGKPQEAYLINRDMMTSDNKHINTTSAQDNIVQSMPLGGGCWSTPSYFNERIYYIASGDVIRSYLLSNGTLTPDLPGTFGSLTFPFPGATSVVSANGADDGIVWAVAHQNPAVLVAYNATNLSSELYDSTQAGSRDQLAGGVTFAAPIVANGKVYVGGQYALSVFGLLNSSASGTWHPVAATYTGLFSQSSGVEFGSSGSVAITTTKSGSYSGKLQLAANKYSFHGKFDSSGAATTAISQKNAGLAVSLQVDTSDNSSIAGTVNGSSWSANLQANAAGFKASADPAPFAGKYGLLFSGPNDGNTNNPQDNGVGTATVSTSGMIKFKGVLGDGTKVNESSSISQSGDWPLFISLYKGQGEITGWLNLNSNAISGQTTWIKEANPKTKNFPNGFVLTPTITGTNE